MSKVIAIIPARGGSKGIKNKNIIPLLNKPLLAYSIEAAQESAVVDEIYVSSDSAEILAVAREYGAKTIERDPSLALDETPTDPAITEFILKANLESKDIILLLQPTSNRGSYGYAVFFPHAGNHQR